MSKCKLYLRAGQNDNYIGTFPSRAKAEEYYNQVKHEIRKKYGYDGQAQPVYVESGKGRGK